MFECLGKIYRSLIIKNEEIKKDNYEYIYIYISYLIISFYINFIDKSSKKKMEYGYNKIYENGYK